MRVSKTFRFESSHILPKHPGKCSRLHGHSWVLHVSVDGPIYPPTGFVIDYAEISAGVKPLIEDLDHRHLGQWVDHAAKMPVSMIDGWAVPGMPASFYPSSENLLWWIGDRLMNKVNWSELILEETCTSRAVLGRGEYTNWEISKKREREKPNP